MLEYDRELDRIAALKSIYEEAIAKINLKMQGAPRGKKLELQKLCAQHESSVRALDRQTEAIQDKARRETIHSPRPISGFERKAAVAADYARRDMEHPCPYCGRLATTFQGCRACLDLIAENNQHAQ